MRKKCVGPLCTPVLYAPVRAPIKIQKRWPYVKRRKHLFVLSSFSPPAESRRIRPVPSESIFFEFQVCQLSKIWKDVLELIANENTQAFETMETWAPPAQSLDHFWPDVYRTIYVQCLSKRNWLFDSLLKNIYCRLSNYKIFLKPNIHASVTGGIKCGKMFYCFSTHRPSGWPFILFFWLIPSLNWKLFDSKSRIQPQMLISSWGVSVKMFIRFTLYYHV